MKFCLDENLSPVVAESLAAMGSLAHEFHSVKSLGKLGISDQGLMNELGLMRFDAIITRDRHQLTIPGEREALARNGLSWIGLPQSDGRGLDVHSADVAAVAGALPLIPLKIPAWPVALFVKSHSVDIRRVEDL